MTINFTTIDWTAVSAIATVGAAFFAWRYVRLTHSLWQEAAKTRETDLMLRLMTDYDRLRKDIVTLREWSGDGKNITQDRFIGERRSAQTAGQPYNIDDARHAVSRFFVRIRKLVEAQYLSEDIVVRALSRQAIEDVFINVVDPLDKIAAPVNYKATDKVYFSSLLHHYQKEI